MSSIAAAALTASVTSAVASPVSPDAGLAVRQRLLVAIPPLVEKLRPGEQLVMSVALLRRLRRSPASAAVLDQPFAWKPAFVRRSLGLAAIEACHAGRYRSPSEAIGPVAELAVTAWRRSGWRTFHWEPWLAALGPGARAAVLAEASTWATKLWVAFDWVQFPATPDFGGPDDMWVCAAPRTIRLKGRSEMRIPLDECTGHLYPGTKSVALVSMAGGVPRPGCEVELAYLALVAALRSPSRPTPARVVGLWPDAGEHRVVDLTEGLLMDAANLVITAVAGAVESMRSAHSAPASGPASAPASAPASGPANSALAALVSGLPTAVIGS